MRCTVHSLAWLPLVESSFTYSYILTSNYDIHTFFKIKLLTLIYLHLNELIEKIFDRIYYKEVTDLSLNQVEFGCKIEFAHKTA